MLLFLAEVGGQEGFTGEAEAADGERSSQTETHCGRQTGRRRGFRERWRGKVHHLRYRMDFLLKNEGLFQDLYSSGANTSRAFGVCDGYYIKKTEQLGFLIYNIFVVIHFHPACCLYVSCRR